MLPPSFTIPIAPPSSLGDRITAGHDRAGATIRRRWGFAFLHIGGLLALFVPASVSDKAGDCSPWSDRPSQDAAALVEVVQPDACCTLAFSSRAGVANLQEIK